MCSRRSRTRPICGATSWRRIATATPGTSSPFRASITLSDAAAGQLLIQNTTGLAKSLTIEGQGSSGVKIQGAAGWQTRILEVVGTGPASVSVVLKNIAIAGGHAHDAAGLAANLAAGGGILIDSGAVTLSGAEVSSNAATGAAGAAGANGTGAAAGGAGGNGGAAQGGGIYLAAGQLTVTGGTLLTHNLATAGPGGAGGRGGTAAIGQAGGAGGNGGNGGSAAGGGIYQANGQINLIAAQINQNGATGGAGGAGGGYDAHGGGGLGNRGGKGAAGAAGAAGGNATAPGGMGAAGGNGGSAGNAGNGGNGGRGGNGGKAQAEASTPPGVSSRPRGA